MHIKANALLLLGALMLALPASPPAFAQTCNPENPECPPPPPPPPPPPEPRVLTCDFGAINSQRDLATAAACGRSVINPQLLIHQIEVHRRITRLSLGVDDHAEDAVEEAVDPAGLGELTPEEVAARLDGRGGDMIIATADVAAAPVATKWNIWVDGKYTFNDSTPEVFDLDGPLVNVLAGADYRLTDSITLGVLASYEESHLESTLGALPPDIDSSGWGIGPYFGFVLTPNIVWSGSYLYSEVDSDQNDFFFFDSVRHQASTAVTGYFYKDTWRFSPSLSLAWAQEQQEEANGLTADQTIESLILTPSFQIGNTLRLSEGATMEPWLGAAFDAVLVNKIDDAVLGNVVDDPYEDLRLQAGLNFSFGSNAQLAISGEIAGLLVDTSDSYSVEANLAIQF